MSRLFATPGLYSSWNSPGQNTGVGSLSLLQGIFPTQGLNQGSPALQADSLPAEPQGKPKNTGVGSLSPLQWIFPTQESNQGSPALQADSLPTELLEKPFPASGSSPVSCLFVSGGQSIRASASASVLPVNIQSISFRMDWLDLHAVQGTLKSLLQHHSSKASNLRCSVFFVV